MVNELYANAFCSDDIRNIENYDIAIADTVEHIENGKRVYTKE